MQLHKLLIAFLFLNVVTINASDKKAVVSIQSLLNEMVDRVEVTRFPASNYRLKQQSSYNRASVTPDEPVGWFTNKDFNSSDADHNFVRIEEKNGVKEWVLMDHEGAGAIVRSWMPWKSIQTSDVDTQIRIYLDGSETPVLEGNMLGLFNGDGLIPYPLAHKSLRSAVSFFPIPYAKSCKVTTSAMPSFFQFTYREYAKGVDVKTFTLDDFTASLPLAVQVGKKLLNAEDKTEGKKIAMQSKLAPQAQKSIKLPKGNAALQALKLKLGDYSNPAITRSIIVKIEFDGMQTVWCPIGDFFGTGIGLHPYQNWYMSVAENGELSSRWLMPYKKSGKLTIQNLSNETVDFVLEGLVAKLKWDDNSMYFNAAWHGQYPVATRPFSDWNYVTLKGRGVYVGDALTVMNPVKRWWGEGDERIWVDGDKFPSIFGTGTEDYYAYSWGGASTDFYEHPFHAQPRSFIYDKLNRNTGTAKNTSGYSTEVRTRALDMIPFDSSLQLDMEVWSGTDCDMGYGVSVFWYADKNTTSNRKPDNKEALNIPPLPKDFPNNTK